MQPGFSSPEFKHEMTEKYLGMVYKIALSQTKDIHYAEDVTSEVFLRYLKTNKNFDSEEHVKAWLIRVAINCSKNVFLNSWFKKTVPLEEDLTFDSPEKSDVYFAVASLPKKYKAVIHLFYYEGLSIEEISSALKIKPSTIKSQLHRGRELLKNNLKGIYEDV